MEDSSIVDRLEAREELIAEQDHVARRELAPAERTEGLAGDELSHEVGRIVLEVGAHEACDVWVVDLGEEEPLLPEVSHEGGPEGELDRDCSGWAVCAPDLAHAPAAEPASERIVPQGLSRLEFRDRPLQGSGLVGLQGVAGAGREATTGFVDPSRIG